MLSYGGMAGKPRLPLVLTDAERRTLQGWASRRKTAQGLAQRARIVLLCAEGKSNIAVAAELGITRVTVGKWRNRFIKQRFAGLSDEPRPGVPRKITDAQIEEVVVRTLEEAPEGATHWSKRNWPGRSGSRRPRSTGSGGPSGSNPGWRRSSSCPPTRS